MVRRRWVFGAAAAVALFNQGSIAAQPVLLQIRPHVGDTLAVRLDQTVEVSGMPSDCVEGAADSRATRSAPRALLCSESTRRMTSVMEVFSRAIVRRATTDGALVLAVTDSIKTGQASGGASGVRPRRVNRTEAPVELQLSTDGGATVVDTKASDELRTIFGQMPGTLSRKPVAVGEKWMRQMRVPLAGQTGAIAVVRATFQLDSLGANGDVAFISMRGTLSRDHSDGTASALDGWMSGSLQLNRRLGWITDTRALIDVTSVMKPAPTGAEMRIRTRITQRLRAGQSR